MKISRLADDVHAVKIQNLLSDNQLSYVWKELEFLTNKSTMMLPEDTGSAKIDGENTKKNYGVFLNDIYKDTRISAIHNLINIKSMSEEVINAFIGMDDMHKAMKRISSVGTLVNYYQNEDRYFWHEDDCVYSVVYYLYKEPKCFTGGDIKFIINRNEYSYEIENNMAIVFPSSYTHSVSPVKMNERYEELSTYGRYCISQFMKI